MIAFLKMGNTAQNKATGNIVLNFRFANLPRTVDGKSFRSFLVHAPYKLTRSKLFIGS